MKDRYSINIPRERSKVGMRTSWMASSPQVQANVSIIQTGLEMRFTITTGSAKTLLLAFTDAVCTMGSRIMLSSLFSIQTPNIVTMVVMIDC